MCTTQYEVRAQGQKRPIIIFDDEREAVNWVWIRNTNPLQTRVVLVEVTITREERELEIA